MNEVINEEKVHILKVFYCVSLSEQNNICPVAGLFVWESRYLYVSNRAIFSVLIRK